MSKPTFITEGVKVDFSKKGGKFAHLGECVVVRIKHAREMCHYEVSPTTGDKKGKIWTLKLRYKGFSHGELSYYCDIVGKAPKALEAAKEVKAERAKKKSDAYLDLVVKKEVNPGDIVTVITSKETYDFKVFEIDYKQGRVKGFTPNTPTYDIGTQFSWASFVHPGVKFKMKQKNAFDPETDPQGVERARNGASMGKKRSATRARRAYFRNMF